MKMTSTRCCAAAAVAALLAGCGSATSTTSSTAGGDSSQAKTTALKVTAPQPDSIVHSQHVTVRGTATPGANVQVQAPTDNAAPTAVSADKQGRWHARILLDRGDNSLTVQASSAGLSTDNPSRPIVIHVRNTPTHARSTTTSTTTARAVGSPTATTAASSTSQAYDPYKTALKDIRKECTPTKGVPLKAWLDDEYGGRSSIQVAQMIANDYSQDTSNATQRQVLFDVCLQALSTAP